MGQFDPLTPEELARITEIQDLMIDRYIRQKQALERGDAYRAKEIELEINGLCCEKEKIRELATRL